MAKYWIPESLTTIHLEIFRAIAHTLKEKRCSLNVTKDRGKRIFLSLPPGILEALERWAESEGNRPTSLANWIVETAVREALDAGKIPSPEQKPSQIDAIDLKAFLTRLASGELPTHEQLETLADELGVEAEVLVALRDRVQKGNDTKRKGSTK